MLVFDRCCFCVVCRYGAWLSSPLSRRPVCTSEDVHVPDDNSTISPVVDEIPTYKVIIDNTVNTEMLVHVHAQIW